MPWKENVTQVLDLYISKFRCPHCTNENGHPELVDSAMADWTCVCCNATQTSKFVSAVTQSIGEELVSLEKGSIEACQSFIRKHSQNLHPNHYYLMVLVSLDAMHRSHLSWDVMN